MSIPVRVTPEAEADIGQAFTWYEEILLRRFPYCVYYIEGPGAVVVIACLHARRDPTAWKLRGRRYGEAGAG